MEHRNGTGNQSRIVRDALSLTSTECTNTKTSSLAVTEVQGDIFFSFKFHWMYAVLPLATVISVAIAFALWKRCSGHAQCFPFMNNRTCHREDPHMLIPTIADTCVLPQEKASSRWHPVQKNRVYTVKDITVLEMIKNGKHGHFYRAQLNHGCCKGHKLIICKVFREGISASLLHSETLIMKKVGYHKHILQFLDCNAVQEPYMLILENVACGTLKQFLKVHRRQLSASENLHSHLTVAAYHIALAMEHIASKMVLHRDLALRNILIGSFPYECKIAEFGYARDLSSRGGATKYPKFDVPLRWYPPEYFRDRAYHLQSDVWSFGILLWEMETLGCSPYPELETPEEVVLYICSGQRMRKPNRCRDDIFKLMEQCWAERPDERPSFGAISKYLEGIVGEDADYIQLEECADQQQASSLQLSHPPADPKLNRTCVEWDVEKPEWPEDTLTQQAGPAPILQHSYDPVDGACNYQFSDGRVM